MSVWVRSTPVNLGGWQQVSAAGAVSAVIPKDLAAGTHRIIVQDAAGSVIGWTEITVAGSNSANTSATGLANTGVNTLPWLAGGVLALMLGAGLLMRRRRISMDS